MKHFQRAPDGAVKLTGQEPEIKALLASRSR